MKERFQIFNGKAVARAFWQIAAIALFTTAASSSAFAGDAQSRLPASQAGAIERNPSAVTAVGDCKVTNLSFSKQGSDYTGTVNIKLTSEHSGPFLVQSSLYGNMGQHNCSAPFTHTNLSVGANDFNSSLSCKPKAGNTWTTFSVSLWQSGSNIGIKCYPQKMPIKGVVLEGMPANPRVYKK